MVKDPAAIDELFLNSATRTVTLDGCVRLKGKRFEVDCAFVGKKVELRFDPFCLDKVLVYFKDKFIQQALTLDVKLNAKLPRKNKEQKK
jgi:hypothetical protein